MYVSQHIQSTNENHRKKSKSVQKFGNSYTVEYICEMVRSEKTKQLIIENELIKKNTKSLLKNRLADIVYNHLIKTSTMIKDIPVTIINWDEVDEDFHILIGENCIKKSDSLIYIGLINKNNRSTFVIFCGDKISSKFQAVDLIHLITKEFGGSGGGNKRFAQGGCSQIGDVQIILDTLNSLIKNS